jgi:hypothetical protein
MWVFHSRIYTTQFRRYVVGLLAHDGGVIDNQPERAIVNPITGVDSQIAKFCAVFADLRKDFDSGVLVHVALVVSRMESSVDAIREYL